MKKLIAFLAIIWIMIPISSQTPEKMSYQCVVRNASGVLVSNQNVGVRISILNGNASGTVVYQETYNPIPHTNANGLLSIEIGGGLPVTGNFSNINWGAGPYFLKTETDPEGGTNYTIIGTSQLLSVPYAMFAKEAGNSFSGNYGDLKNKPALFDGKWNTLTDKPSTTSGYGITDAVTLSGNQTITGNKIFQGTTTVPEPVNATDATTKSYVDALKQQVKVLEGSLIDAGLYKMTDIDGNQYKVVKIGSQVWMAENLKVTRFNDGSAIPLVTDSLEWSNLTTPGYCFYNNDEARYKITYGALYNWFAVSTDKLCPVGWHLFSSDWGDLIAYLGGKNEAGSKLKEAGTDHWDSPNTGATNESGFTALPAGQRGINGTFASFGYFGIWWAHNTYIFGELCFYVTSDITNSDSYFADPRDGLSVRCVKD